MCACLPWSDSISPLHIGNELLTFLRERREEKRPTPPVDDDDDDGDDAFAGFCCIGMVFMVCSPVLPFPIIYTAATFDHTRMRTRAVRKRNPSHTGIVY